MNQNKSWILIVNTFLIINDKNFKPNSITFDYHKHGHSFQIADSLHLNITKAMKPLKSIYDYNHLSHIIVKSRKNTTVEHLNYSDMLLF